MTTFAQRLKAYRIAAGWESARQFALHMGIEPRTYMTYERGSAKPHIDRLIVICQALQITPDDVLCGRSKQRLSGASIAA